jgi:phosphoadenosine phosphosulfate reductase
MTYAEMTPAARIRAAYEAFDGDLILTTSGGETSAALPHLVGSQIGMDFPLVFVDHGFYTSGTYRMIEYFRSAGYDLRIYRSPITPGDVERDYFGWSDPRSPLFSTVVRQIKHGPLNTAFRDLHPRAWLRGIMRFETPEREQADFVQYKNGVYQIHPILDWTRAQILQYLADHDLPRNEDHWDPTKGRDQTGECLIGDHCGLAKTQPVPAPDSSPG